MKKRSGNESTVSRRQVLKYIQEKNNNPSFLPSLLPSLQGVCHEEALDLLLFLGAIVEEHQVKEQRRSAAGAQLVQQREPRYDTCCVSVCAS